MRRLLLLLSGAFLAWRFRDHAWRPAVRLSGALLAATLFSYLVYFRFEEWWYVRFLLPAIPAVLVLMSTGLVSLGRRLPRPWVTWPSPASASRWSPSPVPDGKAGGSRKPEVES